MARGVRKQNKNRLIHFEGDVFNKYGIQFTEQEHRDLKNLADSANRKRRNMIKNEHKLTEFFGGVSHDKTIGELSGKMGKESDFILAKKSKSLHRFQSHEEYENYIRYLRDVVSSDYVSRRVEDYRKNQIKALQKTFGKKSKKLVSQVRSMNTEQFMNLVQSDEASEMWFIYSMDELEKKYKAVSKAINRVTKEINKSGK